MGTKKTLGGDRLGSGNRMKQELHNYFRSNHNLSCARITSAAPGVLYPLYTNIGLTGDTFDIDLNAFVRTLPTEGPMFGAFKLQVDVFTADFRLYQAILHNNTTEIGMQMDQVLLPKIQLTTKPKWVYDEASGAYKWKEQINKSSLMYYLGVSGIGRAISNSEIKISRKFNAIPMLAYYDIFKNYYANKQEENAYVICNSKQNTGTITPTITEVWVINKRGSETQVSNINDFSIDYKRDVQIIIKGTGLAALKDSKSNPKKYTATAFPTMSPNWLKIAPICEIITAKDDYLSYRIIPDMGEYDGFDMKIVTQPTTGIIDEFNETKLMPFELSNIDYARKELLTAWELGEEVVIGDGSSDYCDYLPYNTLYEMDGLEEIEDESPNIFPMQGLVTKCYQSDIFNNWLDSEWVAMISEYSKVNVTNGSFTMDALNLAKKMYNHYNRIAISGGTYDDWQLAAYGEENYGKTEKPVYHGGMSSEVIFDEVVSSVQTTGEDGSVQPLGTLGGRGSLKGTRGGHVIVKCKEACVLMVMVSLTPRLTYSQGNSWYMTELDSIDDLHKPEFDRIGFQDLLTERLAWWDTIINPTQGMAIGRTSVGKQPAWIEYQTDVDKCFGDFAQEDGKGYMVLQRLYDYNQSTKMVGDVTTYIDPSKYNYPFAVNSLTSQNFWIFLNMNIKARRKMSAKQIPNF